MLRILEHAPDALVEHSLERLVALKSTYRVTPTETPAGPPYEQHRTLAEQP